MTPSTPRSQPPPSASSRPRRQQLRTRPTDEGILLPLVFCRECGQDYYTVGDGCVDGPERDVRGPLLSDNSSDETTARAVPLPQCRRCRGRTALAMNFSSAFRKTGSRKTGGGTRVKSVSRNDCRAGLGRPEASEQAMASPPCSFRRRSGSACVRGGLRGTSGPTSASSPTLGSGGRSTATTILRLLGDPAASGARATSRSEARKLLSFTDNRQDASLQAGHFNDFVESGCSAPRSSPRRCDAAGRGADATTSSPQRVFDALASRSSSTRGSEVQVRGPGGDQTGAAGRARLPPLPRPGARLAGHLAQPRAVRPARDRLRLPE